MFYRVYKGLSLFINPLTLLIILLRLIRLPDDPFDQGGRKFLEKSIQFTQGCEDDLKLSLLNGPQYLFCYLYPRLMRFTVDADERSISR